MVRELSKSFRAVQCGRYFALASLAAFLFSSNGFAQDKAASEDSKDTTRITVGSTAGAPGEAVVAPIYVTPGASVHLGRIQLQITYVSANLKFAKLGLGLAADKGDISLKLEKKDSKNEKGIDEETLIVAAEPASGEKEISSGLLGFITLNILEDVKASKIQLRASGEALEAGGNRPVEHLAVISGEVAIEANGIKPIVNCYFFSH